MGWEVTLSWDYPRKYLGYKGILGYLDKGGGGGGLYPGMIPGSIWVTRESRDTWTRGGGIAVSILG